MRHFPAAFAFSILSLAAPAWAQDDASGPKALVSAIFETFRPGSPKPDPALHYSSRLAAIAEDAAENAIHASTAAMSGSVFSPRETFNPFLPDDNALLFDLAIGEPVVLDDRAVVTVSYHNFDAPRLLAIALVKEGEEWKVDDVASLGSETPWLLSWALTADPYAF